MRSRKNAVQFSAKITEELLRLIEYLSVREEVTQVVFIKRAVKHLLAGDREIDDRVLIKRRESPFYIKRDALFVGFMDIGQKEELKAVADEWHISFSQVFFQVMAEYCALLITIDDTGIVITKKNEENKEEES